MAEIKILKIGADGDANEHDSVADQLTFSGFTSDSTNGFTVTGGVSITEDITFTAVTDTVAGIQNQNLLDKTANESITGVYDFSGGNTVAPNSANGAPTEGDFYWDGTSDTWFVYDGTAYVDLGASGSADSVVVTYTAGTGGIAAKDAVYISANDTVLKAAATASPTDNLIGFAPSAITAATSGQVQLEGILSGALTAASAGDKYFLQTTAGTIGTTIPTGSGNSVILAGFAKNATDLQIQIQRIGRRAA